MNATLFKKEIKSNWLLLVIFLAVLSVYAVSYTHLDMSLWPWAGR